MMRAPLPASRTATGWFSKSSRRRKKNPKKWATEVAQNALRALFVEDSVFAALVRILADEQCHSREQLSGSMTVMTPRSLRGRET